ncbi:hypothetical protein [Succinimonas amylolytica]|uniref:hypothetical protein n=1 Tax=Succinimonas amylolytica TaxID=83769 RepID=UPI0023A8B1CA
MNNKVSKIFAYFTFLFSAQALAAPNIWDIGFGQGWQEYSISNEKVSFRIACNEAFSNTAEHMIEVMVNGTDLFAQKDHKLEILISGTAYTFDKGANQYGVPNVITSSQSGADNWKAFIKAVSAAAKIEFYYDGKKAGEVKPKKGSLKKLEYIEESCRPLLGRN